MPLSSGRQGRLKFLAQNERADGDQCGELLPPSVRRGGGGNGELVRADAPAGARGYVLAITRRGTANVSLR